MMLLIVTLLTFTIVAAIILSGYYIVTAESPAAQRLKQLVPEAATPNEKSDVG